MDTLVDEESDAYYRRLEDADFWQSVGRFLEDAMDHVKDHIGREIIRYMYHNRCKASTALKALYGDVPVPYEHYRKAIRQIRAYMKRQAVKRQMIVIGLNDYIPYYDYYGGGLKSFREHGFTSTVEKMAIERADRALRLSDMKDVIL